LNSTWSIAGTGTRRATGVGNAEGSLLGLALGGSSSPGPGFGGVPSSVGTSLGAGAVGELVGLLVGAFVDICGDGLVGIDTGGNPMGGRPMGGNPMGVAGLNAGLLVGSLEPMGEAAGGLVVGAPVGRLEQHESLWTSTEE
jgi:hypothetical protein